MSENVLTLKDPFLKWLNIMHFLKMSRNGELLLSMTWHSFSSGMHSFWMMESISKSRRLRKYPKLYAWFTVQLEWRALRQGRSKHILANITQFKRYRHHWNFKAWITRHYLHSFIHELPSLLNKFPHLKSSPFLTQSKIQVLIPLWSLLSKVTPGFNDHYFSELLLESTPHGSVLNCTLFYNTI